MAWVCVSGLVGLVLVFPCWFGSFLPGWCLVGVLLLVLPALLVLVVLAVFPVLSVLLVLARSRLCSVVLLVFHVKFSFV